MLVFEKQNGKTELYNSHYMWSFIAQKHFTQFEFVFDHGNTLTLHVEKMTSSTTFRIWIYIYNIVHEKKRFPRQNFSNFGVIKNHTVIFNSVHVT